MQYLYLLLLFIGYKTTSAQPVNKRFITVADSKVYVEESGHGAAIILLHAGNCDHRMWDNQMKKFNKYYRVITCDLRGCGLTQDGDSTYLQSDAILAIMDTLKIKSASFIGLSLGSVAATAFALTHPEKVDRLVLASPGLTGIDLNHDSALTTYSRQVAEATAKHDTAGMAEAFVQAWVDGPSRRPEEVDKDVRTKVFEMAYQNIAKRKKDVHIGLAYKPTQLEQLPELKMKILVIAGKKDMKDILMIAEVLKKYGAEVVLFPNAAHMVNMEQPERFNEEVLKFLM